jgi:hypothetical protein
MHEEHGEKEADEEAENDIWRKGGRELTPEGGLVRGTGTMLTETMRRCFLSYNQTSASLMGAQTF